MEKINGNTEGYTLLKFVIFCFIFLINKFKVATQLDVQSMTYMCIAHCSPSTLTSSDFQYCIRTHTHTHTDTPIGTHTYEHIYARSHTHTHTDDFWQIFEVHHLAGLILSPTSCMGKIISLFPMGQCLGSIFIRVSLSRQCSGVFAAFQTLYLPKRIYQRTPVKPPEEQLTLKLSRNLKEYVVPD